MGKLFPHTCLLKKDNADVEKKFIFRFLSVLLPNGIGNVFIKKT
jgi:hypothetical protein